MPDAIHLSKDNSSCLQICLPESMRSLAVGQVEYGATCFDLGYDMFAQRDRRGGLDYLVWTRD